MRVSVILLALLPALSCQGQDIKKNYSRNGYQDIPVSPNRPTDSAQHPSVWKLDSELQAPMPVAKPDSGRKMPMPVAKPNERIQPK